MLLVGIDWTERHHDVCVMATEGDVLARERIPDGVAGVARLHELIAGHASDLAEVVVGIETDRGCWSGRWVGRCRMPTWWRPCGGRVAVARSRPAPPPSRLHWPASSWRLRQWWRLLTPRWWRLLLWSLPA